MNLANYRPISLTNMDYKIIVLAITLTKVKDRLLSKHQSAYTVYQRIYIGINARTIYIV